MKKLISVFLSVVCFASIINIPYAAETENVSYKYTHAVELGFISDHEEPGYIVTRGEFADIVCKVAGIGTANSGVIIYSDVEHGYEYADSIKAVTDAGIMSGYGDGTFKPLEPVKVVEAAKVLLSISGYAPVADVSGGYPDGYVYVAHEVDLMDDMSVGAYTTAIKRHELGIMLFNLMNTRIPSVEVLQTGIFTVDEDDITFGEKYHGLEYVTDIVKANSYTNFSSNVKAVSDSQLVIGEKVYYTDTFRDRFLVGRYVSVFYEEETDAIVSIVERTEDEEIVRMMSYETEILDSNSVMYTDSKGKTKREDFDNEAVYIYNDKYVLSYDLTKLSGKGDFYIEYITFDKKLGYEIVFVYDYYTVVSDGLTSDMTIKSKLLNADSEPINSVNVDEEKTDTLIVTDGEYNLIDPESIAVNDILTVISNTGYTRVIISHTSEKKQISRVYANINDGMVTNDGEAVYPVEELEFFLSENDVVGKTVLIYTDTFGQASYIVVDGTDDELCGILIEEPKLIEDHDEYAGTVIRFKVFTQDEKELNLFSADRIIIGETSIKPSEQNTLPAELSGKTLIPVLYKLNSDGRVSRITLPESLISGNKDGFFKGSTIESAYYSTTQKAFGDKSGEGAQAEVGTETIAFMLKNGIYDSSCSVVVGNSIYNNATDYNVDAYYRSRSNDVADILVIKSDIKAANQNSKAAVISKAGIEEWIGDDVCEKIEYLQDGVVKSAYVNNEIYNNVDVSGINTGDVVLIEVDAKSYISGIKQLYNSKTGIISPYSSNNSWSYIIASVGYVVRNSNGRIRTSSENEIVNDTSVFEMPMHVLSAYNLVLIEDGEEVRRCSPEEIMIGDKVVFVTRAGQGRVIAVYK